MAAKSFLDFLLRGEQEEIMGNERLILQRRGFRSCVHIEAVLRGHPYFFLLNKVKGD